MLVRQSVTNVWIATPACVGKLPDMTIEIIGTAVKARISVIVVMIPSVQLSILSSPDSMARNVATIMKLAKVVILAAAFQSMCADPLAGLQHGELDGLKNAFEQAYQDNSGLHSTASNTNRLLGERPSPDLSSQQFANSQLRQPSPQESASPPAVPGNFDIPARRSNFTQPDNTQEPNIAGPPPSQGSGSREYYELNAPESPIVSRDQNTMWWQPLVVQPVDSRSTNPVNPDFLVQMAMQNSPAILATSLRPLIVQTEIGESVAAFDPELFVNSQFDDRVDPVGNQLTTGNGSPFLEDHIWFGEAGFRKRLWNGGEFEAKQRLGFQNSNSRFFDPQDQGTATLSINFSQPLLRGKGRAFNRSQIVIAQISHDSSWAQYAAELQDELTEVVEAYWTLYFNRSSLIQRQYNVERGITILRKLEGRSGLDTLPSQIARARAAVESRRTELANARRDVKNTETEIRRLTGNRNNFQAVAPELLPMETPVLYRANEDLGFVIEQAIQSRPEIKQAVQRSKVAAVQLDIAEHELLPELNLIFNSYVSALRGQSQIFNAWGDQFTNSTPGYALGIEYNLPYGRRAARARNNRQQLALKQVHHEIDQTVNEVVAETKIAWRQVESAYETTIAAAKSIKAARTDLLQNEARWESFALVEGDLAEGQTPTTLLDQLLDAQQRLTTSELTYSQALLEFKIAEIGLKRATGALLNHQPVPTHQSGGVETQFQSGQSEYPAEFHQQQQRVEFQPQYQPATGQIPHAPTEVLPPRHPLQESILSGNR